MTIRRIDHVEIIVEDLPAAKAFFLILDWKEVKEEGKDDRAFP
jgi:catechol 2,3-dioxygenase-like lactoylglutathione lyase family enzyme